VGLWINCSPTGIFVLSDQQPYVSSDALLRLGSDQAHLRLRSAQVYSGLLTPITRRGAAKNNLTRNY